MLWARRLGRVERHVSQETPVSTSCHCELYGLCAPRKAEMFVCWGSLVSTACCRLLVNALCPATAVDKAHCFSTCR